MKRVDYEEMTKDELIDRCVEHDGIRKALGSMSFENMDLTERVLEIESTLKEVQEFLGHIQPKVGEQAFNDIWETVEETLKPSSVETESKK